MKINKGRQQSSVISGSAKRKFFFGALISLFILLMYACIEPFETEISEQTRILTIEGSLIKGKAEQKVIISNTTTLTYQVFLPVEDCEVKVIDELGNEFHYVENLYGTYSSWIDDEDLVPGRQYQLYVKTPRGKEFISDFAVLNSSPEVDSVYYNIEERIENYSGKRVNGVQFFVDVKAEDTVSRYYRWKLIETYEYESTVPITYRFLDPSCDPIEPRDIWEVFRCWRTQTLPDLFLTNTVNLSVNEKKRIPLNYVDNQNPRLEIKYSLLVEQYSISETAYNYWLQKKTTSEDPGGLYTRQPSQPTTNFTCISEEDEKVLGFFWASEKQDKRIMVPRQGQIQVIPDDCTLRPFDYNEDTKGMYPKYIYVDEETGIEMTAPPACFDCTLKGGTTEKPDYW